ncbi:epidermal growth factor receptor kinase substrate 8-like protein 3 isoform X2 [Emydura macquarii macquarii]|uniref:epidermal growth factor receptor kinase substrate 8-like protein 3 isoform X2 n=1 Tax=Emydura macquarii macquarii TaxID=1129001 RepID=UPI00352B6467
MMESEYSELSNGNPDPGADGIPKPDSKFIYRQRQDYTLSTLKQQSNLQQRVEHLLTVHMDAKDIRGVDDCVAQLKMMEAQGRVWGQNMILQVKDHKLLLGDIETKEELESYPLECIQECAAVLNHCVYNSILAITVQEQSQHRSSIILFQCEQLGAELMKVNLEKAVQEWKAEQGSRAMLRSNLETMLPLQSPGSFPSNPPRPTQERRAESPPLEERQSQDQMPQNPPAYMESVPDQPRPPKLRDEPTDSSSQAKLDLDRDTAILNHVLSDMELFVGKLKEANGTLNAKKRKSKKAKERGAMPPQPEFEACFQKIKYALNLLGKLKPNLQHLSATDLIRLIFSSILNPVVSNCPWTHMAPSIVSPLLTEAAIDLLEESLEKEDRDIWERLGKAWHTTRADYPDEQSIPPYIPTFSDGWVPPPPIQRENATHMDRHPTGKQNRSSSRAPSGPPAIMKAMYDFQARNHKELSVMKGDLLEILDQRRKWWLARNSASEKGYIPNNIVGPVDQELPTENGMNPVPRSSPGLQQNSMPAEVTAWLRDMGFSKITVKCLGVLNGSQLLRMSQEEMTTVCPEEGSQVFIKLSAIKSSLGIRPQD